MKKPFFKTDVTEIRDFAVPVLVEQVSIMVTPFVSSFISRSLGTTAVSGINLVEMLNHLTANVFVAVAIGATVVVSQFRGRKDPEAAGRAGFQAIKLSVLIALATSLLLAVFSKPVMAAFMGDKVGTELHSFALAYFIASIISYPFSSIYSTAAAVLRGAGQTRVSLLGTVVMNLTYIVVGLLAVNVFHMGIVGTGIALVASKIVGMSLMLLLLPRCRPENIVFPKFTLSFDMSVIKPLVKVSVPICIEQILFWGGKLATQRFAVGMDNAQLSANSIANVFDGLFNIPGSTLGSVSMALVGKRIGAKDYEGAKDLITDIMKISFIAIFTYLLLWLPFMGSFMRLYTDDAAIISTLWKMLLLSSISAPFIWPSNSILASAIKGAGDVRFTTVTRLFTVFFVRVATAYTLGVVFHWGAFGIWCGMVTDWFVASVIYQVRYRSMKWLHKGI